MTTRPLSHKRPTTCGRFWEGVCDYHEHGDAATRAADTSRRQSAGIKVVRLGEFARDRMESREGVFDVSLFDATIRFQPCDRIHLFRVIMLGVCHLAIVDRADFIFNREKRIRECKNDQFIARNESFE